VRDLNGGREGEKKRYISLLKDKRRGEEF